MGETKPDSFLKIFSFFSTGGYVHHSTSSLGSGLPQWGQKAKSPSLFGRNFPQWGQRQNKKNSTPQATPATMIKRISQGYSGRSVPTSSATTAKRIRNNAARDFLRN